MHTEYAMNIRAYKVTVLLDEVINNEIFASLMETGFEMSQFNSRR